MASVAGAETALPVNVYRFFGGERIRLIVPATIGQTSDQIVTFDGTFSLPTGSTVNVKGKTLLEAQELVASVLAKESSVKRVIVSIAILELPSLKVYIGGEVRNAQTITLTPGVSLPLAAALAAAGGANLEGDLSRVSVVRYGPDGAYHALSYDTTKLGLAGNTDLGPILQTGDVITVPRGESFILAGEVNKPGVYTRKDLMIGSSESPRLTRILLAAGGLRIADQHGKQLVNRKDIRLIRSRPDGGKDVVWVDFDAALGGSKPPDATVSSDQVQPEQIPANTDPLILGGDIILVGGGGGVAILGKVHQPGIYATGGKTIKLTRLIAQAGGFLDFAKTSSVTVIRASKPKEPIQVNVSSIIKNAALDKDMELEDGDLVFVSERLL
ncbi:MAG: SLBB domain-containing protein [Planctomycetota bacterium]